MDCPKSHAKCKASCCGSCPIPADIFYRNQDKIVTKPIKLTEHYGPDILDDLQADPYKDIGQRPDKLFILPVTESLKCCFLNEDLSCNIYEDRPLICRKYGDETHPMMTCPYQSKEGRCRTRQETRSILRKNEKYVAGYLDKLAVLYGKDGKE